MQHPAALFSDLARSRLFRACTPEDLNELAESAQFHTRDRGFRIAQCGEPFPFLGLVLDGIIGIALKPEGPIRGPRRLSLYEASQGCSFAEITALDRSQPLGEISVLSKHATYALIPAARITEIAKRNPGLLRRLTNATAARCRKVVTRIARQHAWPVSARVARVVLSYASERPGLNTTKPQLAELTQRDIAAAAGCVTEAAARAIAQLERDGALRREHGRIRYADRRRLLRHCARKT